MIRYYISDIIRFIALVLIQILVMNNIQLSGYLNPFFYILFILLLPFETPGWLLLIYGFILGISIDLLTGISGMHASATVFIAFLRPAILKTVAPHDGYETATLPRIYYYGTNWFAKYTFLVVLAHSVFIFFLESFGFSNFFHTLARIILSSLLTASLIIISQFFIFRK
jgi:rod shape-determining protein MreD